MGIIISRRGLLAGGASAAILGYGRPVKGQTSLDPEIELVNDAPLGEMGEFDANFLGPAADKAPRGPFIFPSDADSDSAYGIDISHWTKEVPWSELKGLRINYVYIKASQSARAKDGMFETHWRTAKQHGVPRGAYHWLTPGVPGKEQGEYFVSRIKSGGGLAKADLQPVIDLEWDYLGKNFKRTPAGNGRDKDYWSDHGSSEIVSEVNDCVLAVKKGFPSLAVKPIIYTNRSWWDERLASNVRFDAPVWLADYRQKSYEQHIPRLIIGHDYNLWQFTEKGSIVSGERRYGPFDCNKIIKGDLNRLLIT